MQIFISKVSPRFWILPLFVCVITVHGYMLEDGWSMCLKDRLKGSIIIVKQNTLQSIKSTFAIDSMTHLSRNAPYTFGFFDSISFPVNGNFSLTDSCIYITDFRTNLSGFYRLAPPLWNALNAAISDSAVTRNIDVSIPDSVSFAKASIIAFHYKAFLAIATNGFDERTGFKKYTLHFPPYANETLLRNELRTAGIQFE